MTDSKPQPVAFSRRIWDPRYATARLLLFVLIGVAVTLATPSRFAWRVRAVAGWDVTALLLLVGDWWHILRADARSTARHAASEDLGRWLVWLVALGAAAFSLFSALYVLRQAKAFPGGDANLWSGLALFGVFLAWALTHTSYALRYAHMHYGSMHLSGFKFQGERPPCEIDFAYLAFTIGMTFTVPDVEVTSARTRRTVLFHAMLSFLYNLTILALAVQLAFTWLA